MADFCKQCSIDEFGEDFADLAGLCDPGYVAGVLCEGCGSTNVNEAGECLYHDEGCLLLY